jgi:hypothetical protein
MIPKLILAAALAGICLPAQAGVINYELQHASLSGAPGDVLTFTITLTNPSATDTVWLNGDGSTSASPFLTIDDSFFAINAPFFLDPLGVSPPFDIFQVSIAPTAPDGPLVGSIFTILGGADSGALDDLADISFDVNVRSATATPEPGTFGGLIVGLLAIVCVGVRTRRAAGIPRESNGKADFAGRVPAYL